MTPKDKPILFSGEMVRAILSDRKTITRRIVKPQPFDVGWWDGSYKACRSEHEMPCYQPIQCPYGKQGDTLWVRETFYPSPNDRPTFCGFYRATDSERKVRWIPSIHMPRWASRITLEIIDVRVERLQEISEEDAKAEGCCGGNCSIPNYPFSATPREHFRYLWESIYGKDSWNLNPWLWVLSFRRIKP